MNPAVVVQQLRTSHDPGDEAIAEQALTHMRDALLSGHYVAVEEDSTGRTFIGTEDEAVDYMMADAGS